MSDAVLRSTQGRIGILTVNNPPVNALAAAVRDGIKEGVDAFAADSGIDAIVLIGGGRTFIAGADIREFGKPPKGANLNDVIATMENCPKIIVAALHGTPLGGAQRHGERAVGGPGAGEEALHVPIGGRPAEPVDARRKSLCGPPLIHAAALRRTSESAE